jgi:hypothetical protein
MNLDYKQFKKDIPVPQQLDRLLHDLAIKIPTLKFEVINTTYKYELQGQTQVMVGKVAVFNGYEEVGAITIERKEVDGTEFDVFDIKSRLIKKARGRQRDTKQTKNYKIALATAISAFARTAPDIVAEEINNQLSSEMSSMIYNVQGQAQRYVEKNWRQVLTYLSAIREQGPISLTAYLADTMAEKGDASASNLRIAESVKRDYGSKSGVVIRIERDDTINVVDVATNSIMLETKSTYDLPTNYQEKFTMLKIVESSQPIENVGVKFISETSKHKGIYYLVGGDTVTTC